MTCAAVLIDPASRLKRVAIAPALIPDLVHAVEAYTCRPATALTRPLAVGAARLLGEVRELGDRLELPGTLREAGIQWDRLEAELGRITAYSGQRVDS